MIDFDKYNILVPPDLDESLLDEKEPAFSESGNFNYDVVEERIKEASNDTFSFTTTNYQGQLVIELAGLLDKRAVGELSEKLAIIENVDSNIILDFSNVHFLNSFALDPILEFIKKRQVYSTGLNNRIIGVIKMLDVQELFNFRQSYDDIINEINIKKTKSIKKNREKSEVKEESKEKITIKQMEKIILMHGYRHLYIDPDDLKDDLKKISWDKIVLDFSLEDNIMDVLKFKDIEMIEEFAQDNKSVVLIGIPAKYINNKKVNCFNTVEEFINSLKNGLLLDQSIDASMFL